MTNTDEVKLNELTMERDSLKEQVASLQRSAAMMEGGMKDMQKVIEERDITILQLRVGMAQAHGSLAMHQSEMYGPQLDAATAAYRAKYQPQAPAPTDANKPKARKKAKG